MSLLLERVLYRALPLVIALAVLMLLRWSGLGVAASGSQSTTIAIGFMLMAAFVGGKLAVRTRLPRITGYMAVGLVMGPHVSGLLTQDMLLAAEAVEGIAVTLIALTAGGEIRLEWAKRQAGRLAGITGLQLLVVVGGVMGLVLAAKPALPFVPDAWREAAVMAMLFGVIAAASSPTVAIAIVAENQAEGPLARTVLGVTILKDVCVIVLFAVAVTYGRDVLGTGDGEALAWTLLRELGGSVAAGVGFGIAIAAFLRYVGRDAAVFVLIACFAMWQMAVALHLESLLIALTAGFWVENFSKARGEALIRGIERLSLPVYALFFASAGAKVDIGTLAVLWPSALLLSGSRALCLWASTSLGAGLCRVEATVRRYAWLGFISQAGVTLALATIIARTFPTWGDRVQALLLAMIAIHELIGPIAFQLALRRAKEVGAAAEAPAAHPEPARAPS